MTGRQEAAYTPIARLVVRNDVDAQGRIWQRLECDHSVQCLDLTNVPGLGACVPMRRYCKQCTAAATPQHGRA